MDALGKQVQTKFETAEAVFAAVAALVRVAAGEGSGGALVAAGEDAEALLATVRAKQVRFALATAPLFLRAVTGGEAARGEAKEEFLRAVAVEDVRGCVDAAVERVGELLVAAGLPLRIPAAAEVDVKVKKPVTSSRSSGSSGDAVVQKPTKVAKKPALSSPRDAGLRRSDARREGYDTKVVAAILGAPASAKGYAEFVRAAGEVQRCLDAFPRPEPPGPHVRAAKVESAAEAKRREPNAPGRVDYGRCGDCNRAMDVDQDGSELKCRECGAVRGLDGVVFDDAQFYSQEGQKAKSGSFNPSRHFQFWWTRIYAREPQEELGDPEDEDNLYGEKIIERLRGIIRRDCKILQMLTITDVRKMLQEIKRTDLNKNASLILRLLTGVGPPIPSEELTHKVEKRFTKAVEIGERNARADRVNRSYYPYTIFKLLHAMLPADDKEARRVFRYIYLQSDETLRNDDLEWQTTCQDPDMADIPYVPTDRTIATQYNAFF
ncbi:MAG: hypothetical protein KGL39_35445 [Patescibacteria group bacterium]|nr:hypothetical protein [Patescibacteria group bacterium]